MPEALWLEAVELTSELGVHRVANQLRLNYDRLKLRVVQGELEQLRQLDAGESDREVPVGFVELQSSTLFDAQGPAVAEVELARADGARMIVRMGAAQPVDLVELSESFFGAGQ